MSRLIDAARQAQSLLVVALAWELVVRGGLVADGRGGEPRRADVAVDDTERTHSIVTPTVRVVQTFGDFGGDVDAQLDRQGQLETPTPAEHAREIEPVDVFHRHVVGAGRSCS